MGANCCVSGRNNGSSSIRVTNEVSTHRNSRYSPSWSFRWDNRTHIEDIVDNHAQFSRGNSWNVGSEIKSAVDTETGLSDGGSPSSSFQTLRWQKSPSFGGTIANTKGGETDASIRSHSPTEDCGCPSTSSIKSSRSNPDILIQTPPSLAFKTDPSSSHNCASSSDPTPSKMYHPSGHHLSRQISDSHIPVLKSLGENNSMEGRQSFVLPTCSSDLSTGLHGGSSDGWSMRMFSELVASSRRDRWSFDSENYSFGHSRRTRTNGQAFVSPPQSDLRPCGVCSNLLMEKSSWKSLELSVVAVLVCGHVYHAECLEHVTSEINRYDPSCPVCANGGKTSSKLLKKSELKAWSKKSRIAVADIDLDGDSPMKYQKGHEQNGKVPKMSMSSSMKLSFNRPFLRRHFSIGSKTTSRSLSENEGTRKKSFWTRYRKY